MKHMLLFFTAGSSILLGLVGCQDSTSPGDAPPGTIAINVVVPALGPSVACFELRVDDGAGVTVLERGAAQDPLVPGSGPLCFASASTQALTLACDPSAPEHRVTVWFEGAYDEVGGPIDVQVDYPNLCADGCSQTVACVSGATTEATVALDPMATFDDWGEHRLLTGGMWCQTKVACLQDEDPLMLLHHPETGLRDQTAVLQLACVGQDSAGPVLLRDAVEITCGADTVLLDVGRDGAGLWDATNLDPAPDDAVWQYAVYHGDEGLGTGCWNGPCVKRYWNVAVGFDAATPDCTMKTRFAAGAATRLTGFSTPADARYPWVDVVVPLTMPSGGLACDVHQVELASSDAATGIHVRYTDPATPMTFCHRLDAEGLDTDAGCAPGEASD